MATNIVLGGGCFWCIEAVFTGLLGVESTRPGYAGGRTSDPTYHEVCGKKTGHVEVVLVEFNEDQINLQTLLEVFFTAHDPTQVNRQGNDIGPQYRSCIFTMDETQVVDVGKGMADAESMWGRPLATTVEPLDTFWPAESEHVDYFAQHPHQSYCVAVVSPKVAKVRASFSTLYGG